jgi:hypothetical protein
MNFFLGMGITGQRFLTELINEVAERMSDR